MINGGSSLLDDIFNDDFFKIGTPSNFLRKSKPKGQTITEETTQTLKDGTVIHRVVTHQSHHSSAKKSKGKMKKKKNHNSQTVDDS